MDKSRISTSGRGKSMTVLVAVKLGRRRTALAAAGRRIEIAAKLANRTRTT